MKKDEILNFIKSHTLEFEKELREREKRVNWFPRPGFERTAACNVQKKRDFDQDLVIQDKWQNLTDYIVQVTAVIIDNTKEYSLTLLLCLGHRLWYKIDTCQTFEPVSKTPT